MHTVNDLNVIRYLFNCHRFKLYILYGNCTTVCGQRKLWCCCDSIREPSHAKTVSLVCLSEFTVSQYIYNMVIAQP